MSRYEIKYLIPQHQRTELLCRIAARLRPDPNGRGHWGTYAVHSLYFDSPTLAAYREKIDGVGVRNKVRLRTYKIGSPACFLEIKQRRHQHIKKYKLKMDRNLLRRVMRGLPLAGVGDNQAARIYNGQVAMWGIAPKVLVSYQRDAFVSRLPGNLRITFDTDIRAGNTQRWVESNAADRRIWPAGLVVAEVKFERLMPRWLQQLIRDYSLMNRSISKYCHGVDLLGYARL